MNKSPENYLCPRCGGLIPSNLTWGQYPGAISRHLGDPDEGTLHTVEVCSDCGVEEALIDFGGDDTPVDIYPILTEPAMNRRFEAIVVIERHNDIRKSERHSRRLWRNGGTV